MTLSAASPPKSRWRSAATVAAALVGVVAILLLVFATPSGGGEIWMLAFSAWIVLCQLAEFALGRMPRWNVRAIRLDERVAWRASQAVRVTDLATCGLAGVGSVAVLWWGLAMRPGAGPLLVASAVYVGVALALASAIKARTLLADAAVVGIDAEGLWAPSLSQGGVRWSAIQRFGTNPLKLPRSVLIGLKDAPDEPLLLDLSHIGLTPKDFVREALRFSAPPAD